MDSTGIAGAKTQGDNQNFKIFKKKSLGNTLGYLSTGISMR